MVVERAVRPRNENLRAVGGPAYRVARAVSVVAQARRIALAAQGFLDPPHATPTMRTFARTLQRTGVLQVDSVNVLQRAHYMPLYSRMGPYDVDLLRRAAESNPRRVVEYWAHVQAFMPVDLWPVMQHRMASYRDKRGKWGFVETKGDLDESVLEEIRERGPATARDLDDDLPRSKKHWGWNWSETRKALDYLFVVGEVAIAGRNSQFEVLYDVPERVIPPDILALPTPSVAEASRELVRRAAVSHGVATIQDLRDYYRMPVKDDRRRRGRAGRGGRAAPGRGRGMVAAGATCIATRGCPGGSTPGPC